MQIVRTGALGAAAAASAQAGRTEGWGGRRDGEALSSQGTGHCRSLRSRHGPCCVPNQSPSPGQRCSAARLSAPTACNLRDGTSQANAPRCAPGEQVPALLDLQSCFFYLFWRNPAAPSPPHSTADITGTDAGSAPPSAPVPSQYCPERPEHFSPELQQVAHPACASARTEQGLMGWRCLLPCRLLLGTTDTTGHVERCQARRTGAQAARAPRSS